MREEFKINWVDQWLHQVFSAFDRLRYRGDIMIEHRHWVLGKNVKDNTADRMAVADVNKISDKLWYSLKDERVREKFDSVPFYAEVRKDTSARHRRNITL